VSRGARHSGAVIVRGIHNLAGEGIDDPGAQFGTDSSIGDVFFIRCRAVPANTISTRSTFYAAAFICSPANAAVTTTSRHISVR
jgi:hypothetical protein